MIYFIFLNLIVFLHIFSLFSEHKYSLKDVSIWHFQQLSIIYYD